ncbi:hypothetical protein EON66_01375 [archaeon]|nr:MAG: hypothetical protein EON66_01375 [archaeon]
MYSHDTLLSDHASAPLHPTAPTQRREEEGGAGSTSIRPLAVLTAVPASTRRDGGLNAPHVNTHALYHRLEEEDVEFGRGSTSEPVLFPSPHALLGAEERLADDAHKDGGKCNAAWMRLRQRPRTFCALVCVCATLLAGLGGCIVEGGGARALAANSFRAHGHPARLRTVLLRTLAVISLVLALAVVPAYVQARVDATQLAFLQVNMTQPSAAAGGAQGAASVTLDIRAVLSGLSPIGGKLLCTLRCPWTLFA